MRDPSRIPAIMYRLETLWRKCPDMRLSQLLMCCASTQTDLDPSNLFYVEDTILLDGIEQFDRNRELYSTVVKMAEKKA
jgi:hypothetical protein